jgi:hypothetical protein
MCHGRLSVLGDSFVSGPRTAAAHLRNRAPDVSVNWQCAREAMLSVGCAKTDEEKRDPIELARTWTQAALHGQAPPLVDRQEPGSG